MWVIGSVVAVVGLLAVLVALVLDPPAPAPRATPRLPPGLPRPAELGQVRFPPALRGYDPRAVDAWLREVTDRYETLYLAAGPSVLARADAAATPADAASPTEAATDAPDREGPAGSPPAGDAPADGDRG